MTTNNVVSFLTQNNKLCNQLQSALKEYGLVVFRAENIQAVNKTVKNNAVSAVVLHVKDSNGWIIFELLRTGYPNIPKFVILAPSVSGEELEMEVLAQKYGAKAITTEKNGVKALASLITSSNPTEPELGSKDMYLKIFGEVTHELLRLQKEFAITALRTLPQPEIGDDSLNRLKTTLAGLQEIKIIP